MKNENVEHSGRTDCSSVMKRIADWLARITRLAEALGVCVCGCPKSQHTRGRSCATVDCDCHEYRDNTVARCKACDVPFSGHDGIQDTCKRLHRADEILWQLYDNFCEEDSYGVSGSNFRTCKRCHTGGSPTIPWKHAEDCEIKKIEDYLFGLD
jgi:hypothetical protein